MCKFCDIQFLIRMKSNHTYMSKILNIQIPDTLQKELDERCKQVGCNEDDYIKETIEYVLKGYSTFDFGLRD